MEKLTTAVKLGNFENESSRYIPDVKNMPISRQIYCNEYVADDRCSFECIREQVLISGDTQILIKLPKATVRLLIFANESHKLQ